MKPILLPFPPKASLFALLVLAASFSLQGVYAQTAVRTSMQIATLSPEKDQAAATSSNGFQAIVFPTQNASKIKVILEDLTGNGTLIAIRNTDNQLVHQINCFSKGVYVRVFDLSMLPDGDYSLEIMALSKVGLVKQKYMHTFKLQSTTERSITPWNKTLQKRLFTPRHAQVSR